MSIARLGSLAVSCVVLATAGLFVNAQDAGVPRSAPSPKNVRPGYSPYAKRNFPSRPYFGDTHLHTSFSMDAGAFGCRLGPEDAYRFGRGEELKSSSGQMVKLSRPLDFLVVADHSDNMGFFPALLAGTPALLKDPTGKKWYDMIQGAKATMRRWRSSSRSRAARFPRT